MNMVPFYELFARQLNGYSDKLNDKLYITSLDVDKAKRVMSIGLFVKDSQVLDEISYIKNAIKRSFNLSSLVFKYKFDGSCYDSKAVGYLFNQSADSYIGGFIYDADILAKEHDIDIGLKHGGYQFLIDMNYDGKFADAILDAFDKEVNITFSGMKETEFVDIPEPEPVFVYEPKITNEPVEKKEIVTLNEDKFPIKLTSAEHIWGYKVNGLPINLSDLEADGSKHIVWGEIFFIDKALTKKGDKYRVSIFLTDGTNSHQIKMAIKLEDEEKIAKLKNGVSILVKGELKYDDWEKDNIIRPDGIDIVKRIKVTDTADEKRVELHLHTNMSQMDALTPASDLIKRAAEWGHKAIAITDHGVVQAFPEVMNTVEGLKKSGKNIKPIYGCEAYS